MRFSLFALLSPLSSLLLYFWPLCGQKSGRPDSNWRLPAPKAGALTRLRYAPVGRMSGGGRWRVVPAAAWSPVVGRVSMLTAPWRARQCLIGHLPCVWPAHPASLRGIECVSVKMLRRRSNSSWLVKCTTSFAASAGVPADFHFGPQRRDAVPVPRTPLGRCGLRGLGRRRRAADDAQRLVVLAGDPALHLPLRLAHAPSLLQDLLGKRRLQPLVTQWQQRPRMTRGQPLRADRRR